MDPRQQDIEDFVTKWTGIRASELSTSQSFLIELCRLLDVPTPHATPEQDYMFERPVTFTYGDGSFSSGRIDLYRRGAFVLESKKIKAGSANRGFDEALLKARSQAENYARALPAVEGRPPFLVVVDVGHRIELYSEFSRSGGTYTPFPDPRRHRISLHDLHRPEIFQRLRMVWLDPLRLDPSREASLVTRAIANRLAELAVSLERDGHAPHSVAQFLMRCVFTMFAEDVRLLPEDSFKELLSRHLDRPSVAMRMLAQLWRDMDEGGFSAAIATDVLRFNGKLFKTQETLPLNGEQLLLLLDAARADWRHVEPAIFGTLLERALDPVERHRLGAHYTPRDFVERLVLPTVIEPLRDEWATTQAFDPACGSGNFLYVTLEHLKRLEGEVLNQLDELDFRQAGLALGSERADAAGGETVDPHNLMGIELNPRAAAIAEVVLWIGYLQWHFRTHGDINPPIPVVRDFRNIECRDAVLACDGTEPVVGDDGRPVTRWDGVTRRTSPTTGEEVPDTDARVAVVRYLNARRAPWPEADFIVGNPPYIGVRRLRNTVGDEYVDTVRAVYPEVPETCDYVMYWWEKAAQALAHGTIRFGLITTNSIVQAYSRRMLDRHLGTDGHLRIVFAIAEHPWVDEAGDAAVGVAMTVAAHRTDTAPARLGFVTDAADAAVRYEHVDRIGTSLDAVSVHESIVPLRANAGLCFQGVVPAGDGFKLTPEEYALLGVECTSDGPVRRYILGRDVVQKPQERYIVDFFGVTESDARASYPSLYQRLRDRVYPDRLENKRDVYRQKWWVFAEQRPALRAAVAGLNRYIGTPYTAKHRPFVFVPPDVIPDAMVYVIASDDAAVLGVLSSVVHTAWSGFTGGTLEDRPRYNSRATFFPFPFPDQQSAEIERIAELAEAIDALRKQQMATHAELSLTATYNVLHTVRDGIDLDTKARRIYEQACVGVLGEYHDELDALVLSAYGWSDLVSVRNQAYGDKDAVARADAWSCFEAEVVQRLVHLNRARAAEEALGNVHRLRSHRNLRADAVQVQGELATENLAAGKKPVTAARAEWPREPVEQLRTLTETLARAGAPLSLSDITARYKAKGPWKKRVPQLLDMLVAVGRAYEREGRYSVQ
jgi:hypothetical protein